MKVYSIVTEDVSEAIPFTKKARMMRQAGKAAKGATKDETRQLEVELLTYLKTSGQTATADAVLKYLDQKGYGNVAAPIIANLKTKGNKKADRQAARADKRQAKADAKAAAAADAEKAAGLEKQRKGMATMSSMYSESEKRWKQTSMSSAEATKKYGKENVKVKKGGLNNGDDMVSVFVESQIMSNEAAGDDVLTKREVRSVIKQVVQKGYGGAAGFSKGKFAAPDPKFKSANAKPDPEIQKAADLLKKAGYTVSK